VSKVPTAQGPPSRRLTGSDGADTAGLRGLQVPIEGSIAGRVFRAGEAEDVDSIASTADVVAAEPALAEHPGYGPTLVGLAPHSLAALPRVLPPDLASTAHAEGR
jgi:hypothetical protein